MSSLRRTNATPLGGRRPVGLCEPAMPLGFPMSACDGSRNLQRAAVFQNGAEQVYDGRCVAAGGRTRLPPQS
eukprot:8280133-Pyramimonas_sp.AAC.1